MCVVYVQCPVNSDKWLEIGRTEIIWDNVNPEFSKKIPLDYQFQERQMLRFEVYDVESPKGNLADHDFVGSLEVSLGEIVSTGALFERPLENDARIDNGTICIVVEEVSSCKEDFLVKLFADGLSSNFFNTKRYFFEIHKTIGNSGFHLVYRSGKNEPSNGTVEWPQFQVNKYTLCNGEIDRQIVFTLYKFKRSHCHRPIGNWNTTVKDLIENRKKLPIVHHLSPSGPLFRMANFSKGVHSSFLDFITIGGVQMHCFLAIDFTASNGHPSQPSSLHNIHPVAQNQYQTALRSVTEIIQDYDSDKLFPVLGFGAKLPPKGNVSHEFYVNFHPTDPYCAGVDGVLKAYATAVRRVQLDGPSNFAPIISHVSKFAAANTDGRNYFILLIITNGVISDIGKTINAIVAASHLPMSIIIVGVGDGDFGDMEVLDADIKPLVDSSGRTMKRDIVQFVPFNEVMRKSGNNSGLAKINLARYVLYEFPTQFLTYMKGIGVTAKSLASLPSDNNQTPNKFPSV